MQDFIQSAVGQLGIDEGTAQSATSSLLGLLKDQGDDAAAGQLMSALPGADGLARQAGGAVGGLGGAMGGLGAMLGGSAGSAMGAVSALQSSGLSGDQLGPFVSMFVGYAREKAGPDVVERLLSSVPALKQLI